MKSLHLKLGALGVLSLTAAQSAYAHDGEHGTVLLSNITHWLSSPTHSLFALIAGLGFVGVSYMLTRKPRSE